VLWGIRSNSSTSGVLQLNNLIISQPGLIEFKIAYKIRNYNNFFQDNINNNNNNNNNNNTTTILEIFKLEVKNDPSITEASPSMFVFKNSFCPITSIERDWIEYFPKTRSYLNSTYYLQNIYCQEKLRDWFVDAFLNVDGSMWIEYRVGIDAIWTGF
jgi:hypothetical protein